MRACRAPPSARSCCMSRPEAQAGGPLALVQTGDRIRLSASHGHAGAAGRRRRAGRAPRGLAARAAALHARLREDLCRPRAAGRPGRRSRLPRRQGYPAGHPGEPLMSAHATFHDLKRRQRLHHRRRLRHRRGADRRVSCAGREGRLRPALGRDGVLRRDGGKTRATARCSCSATSPTSPRSRPPSRRRPRRTGRSRCSSTTPPTTSATDTRRRRRGVLGLAIAINLKAYFFACQAVVPGMQAAGGGSIINFSLDQLHDGECGLSGLHHRQCRHQRADPRAGARIRARQASASTRWRPAGC